MAEKVAERVAEMRALGVRWGERTVLDAVDLRLLAGERLVVVGPSGAGKSTILRLLAGLQLPTSGELFIHGEPQTYLRLDQRHPPDVRLVFQNPALLASLTVRENVGFLLYRYSRLPDAEIQRRVSRALEAVGLYGIEDRLPGELSGGMQKRVGIARAIAMNPKYLFCDEPNSGLDPQTSIVIDELIKELTQEFNTTTIVITHDMNSVMETGENIIFVHNGRMWWSGTREELLYSDNEELNAFIFASEVMRVVKRSLARKP